MTPTEGRYVVLPTTLINFDFGFKNPHPMLITIHQGNAKGLNCGCFHTTPGQVRQDESYISETSAIAATH